MDDKLYYIVGELVEEDGPDCDMFGVMYKTKSLERAESFVQSFREGLRGFYVERDGGILNAFQVVIKSSDDVGGPTRPDDEDILEVPDPNEIYAKKILCFDYTYGDKDHPMCLNHYHYNWFGRCMTVASVILSKMVDPSGEFAKMWDELKFGQDLVEKGYEIMPSQGWATDQIFIVTDILTDEENPEISTVMKYCDKANEIVYGGQNDE